MENRLQPIRWVRVNGCLLPAAGPSAETRIARDEALELMRRRRAVMLRATGAFDCADPSPGWYVVKERFGDLEELSASTRSKVRRALRRCVYRRAVDPADPATEHWTILAADDLRKIGFAVVRIYGDEVFYDRFRARPDSLRGYYPLYGLLYAMNRHYLAERGMARVCDGFRTMRERSAIQPFLMEKFRFRRAYCSTLLYYRPWFGGVVRWLYPVRRWLPGGALRALFRQHALFASSVSKQTD